MTPLKYCQFLINHTNEKTGHNFTDTHIINYGCKIKCSKCGYKTKITIGDMSSIDNINDIKIKIHKEVMTCSQHIIKNIIE